MLHTACLPTESNGVYAGGDSDVLVINEAESNSHDGSSASSEKERIGVDPAARDRNKKHAVLQMLILQLASALRWLLKEIDGYINLAMQHTLLEILLASTSKVRGWTVNFSDVLVVITLTNARLLTMCFKARLVECIGGCAIEPFYITLC